MEEIDVLLVVGFSYRDPEIVDTIKDRVASGMYLISFSPTATEDIRHVASDVPKDVAGSACLKTIGRHIILCETKFGPETLDTIRASLERTYDIIRAGRMHSA